MTPGAVGLCSFATHETHGWRLPVQGKKLRLDDAACFKAKMSQVFHAYHPLPGGHVLDEWGRQWVATHMLPTHQAGNSAGPEPTPKISPVQDYCQ